MNRVTHQQPPSQRCPFLGLHDDSSTSLAYGSPWNYCYRCDPPGSILVSHQVKVCLCHDFAACPVYHSTTWQRLPRNLRSQGKADKLRDQSSSKAVRVIELLLLAAILTLLLLYAPQILP